MSHKGRCFRDRRRTSSRKAKQYHEAKARLMKRAEKVIGPLLAATLAATLDKPMRRI